MDGKSQQTKLSRKRSKYNCKRARKQEELATKRSHACIDVRLATVGGFEGLVTNKTIVEDALNFKVFKLLTMVIDKMVWKLLFTHFKVKLLYILAKLDSMEKKLKYTSIQKHIFKNIS